LAGSARNGPVNVSFSTASPEILMRSTSAYLTPPERMLR
jgi:hypothetical protein